MRFGACMYVCAEPGAVGQLGGTRSASILLGPVVTVSYRMNKHSIEYVYMCVGEYDVPLAFDCPISTRDKTLRGMQKTNKAKQLPRNGGDIDARMLHLVQHNGPTGDWSQHTLRGFAFVITGVFGSSLQENAKKNEHTHLLSLRSAAAVVCPMFFYPN